MAIVCCWLVLGASSPLTTHEPSALLLDEIKNHDVLLLGTRHHSQPILDFISALLPKLSKAGVTHIGLEIESDQQIIMDRLIKQGRGLTNIDISPIIDCPAYRNLFTVIQAHNLKPIALDLPRSMWKSAFTRDQWMAELISKLFDRQPEAKMVVVVGNLHVIKKVEWINTNNNETFIRGYLTKYRPDLKIFSIAECNNYSDSQSGLYKFFKATTKPVALKTKGLDHKLKMLSILAAKPMTIHEAVDGLILY